MVRVREGDRVSFKVRDAFVPTPNDLLAYLTEETELQGTIVGFSDSGPMARYFAVVGVTASRRVIVPLDRIRRVLDLPENSLDPQRSV